MPRNPQDYKRVLLAAAAIGAYILAFLLLYPAIGRVVTAGAVIPMGALGLLWGTRAGALGAICSIPANTLLMHVAAGSGWDVMLQPFALPGVIGAIIVGTVTGGLRDLRAEAEQARTERYRADAKVLGSERRFRALIEKSSDGIALVDGTGRMLYLSPSIKEVQGYSPEELLGRNAFELMHPDDQELTRTRLAELLRGTRSVSAEYRFRHKDGSWPWFKGVGTNMLDDPDVGAIVVNFQDISERKGAEQALRDSEARTRAIVDTAMDCIVTINHEGKILEFNPAAERVFGYSRTAVIGKVMAELIIPPRLREAHRQSLTRHVATGVSSLIGQRIEMPAIRADGSEFPVELTITRIVTDGHPIFTGYLRDITERRRAEAEILEGRAVLEQRVAERTSELREAKTFLEHLAAASPGVVLRVDLHDLRPTYVSPNVERLYGYAPQEFLGQPTFWMGIVHPDDLEGLITKLKLVLAGQTDHVSHEVRLQHKDGTYRWLDFDAVAEHDAAGNPMGVLGYAVDMTERKKIERNLQEARRDAEQANRAKSEFLSRMSHELRTPLNAILGFAQLLEMEPHTPEAADCIGYILRGGQHLLELINEVLDITRIEAGRLELSPEPVAIEEVIADSLSLIAPLAAQRNVQLNTELAAPHEGYVMADRQRLKQILLNLLSNAVKYNREGGLVAISVTETPRGRRRINVIDTGPGIAPDKLDRLFTPFERLGQSTVEGTGIGLALSRRLARLLGGDVGVETQEGQGSTFWVELDAANPPVERLRWTPPEREPMSAVPGDEAEQRSRSVLYVEDNLSNLELIRRALATRGAVTLHTAMSGRQGVGLAQDHRPDLVLLDLHLPDMPGIDVMRELRSDPRTAWIPIVVISADATPDQRARLLASGAQAFLTKPLDLNRLFSLLDDSLMVGGPASHD